MSTSTGQDAGQDTVRETAGATAEGRPAQTRGDTPVKMERLHRVGARPTLANYLRRLWNVRHFIVYEAKVSVGVQNRQNVLGNLWLVLNPLLNGATYFLIFGILLGTSRGIENFLGYLTIGVFMFSFTSRTVLQGANSLNRKNTVVEAFNFPRIALPVSTVLREVMTYGITLVTMLVVVLLIPPLEEITWRWVLLIPVVVLQILMILGLGLLFARMVSRIRDFAQVLTFALRVWMYGSGVFYSFDRFVSHPTALAILEFNPMHQVLDITRQSILYGSTPGWDQWLILGGWSIGLLVVGTLVFWWSDESLGRDANR